MAMAIHGAAAHVLIASLLLAVALSSGADARLTAVLHDANGGYVLEEKLPDIVCSRVVMVQPGQTCSSVAQGNGVTQDNFLAFNPNINCDNLFAGEWVCLLANGA